VSGHSSLSILDMNPPAVLWDVDFDFFLDSERTVLEDRNLESRGGWHHVVGSIEQYRIDDPAAQRQPNIGRIESIRVARGELTLRATTGDWHETLVPGHTQLLRFG
jgi:hypothetical protein